MIRLPIVNATDAPTCVLQLGLITCDHIISSFALSYSVVHYQLAKYNTQLDRAKQTDWFHWQCLLSRKSKRKEKKSDIWQARSSTWRLKLLAGNFYFLFYKTCVQPFFAFFIMSRFQSSACRFGDLRVQFTEVGVPSVLLLLLLHDGKSKIPLGGGCSLTCQEASCASSSSIKAVCQERPKIRIAHRRVVESFEKNGVSE